MFRAELGNMPGKSGSQFRVAVLQYPGSPVSEYCLPGSDSLTTSKSPIKKVQDATAAKGMGVSSSSQTGTCGQPGIYPNYISSGRE